MISGLLGSAGGGIARFSGDGDDIIIGDRDTTFHADADNNIAIGLNALDATAGAALRNIAIGTDVLTALTTGDDNVGIGGSAGAALTTGGKNTIIGSGALDAQVGDGTNVTTGGHLNVVIGTDAMGGMNTGSHASATLDSNIAIGESALSGSSFGSSSIQVAGNVAIGHQALYSTANNTQTGTIGIGYKALTALTSGAGNIAIGYQAMDAQTTGGNNIAIGYQAMGDVAAEPAGTNNTFMGYQAGGGTWQDSTISENVGIGNYTLAGALNSAQYNTAVGYKAGQDMTSGDRSVLIGYQAGKDITTGENNVCIGSETGQLISTGGDHVLIGRAAGTVIAGSQTTTNGTVAIGHQALNALTGGVGNLAIGYKAMLEHTTGVRNLAIGYGAMDDTGANDCPTSTDNIFIGYDAGGGTWTTDDANQNVGIGNYVMDAAMNGALSNTAVGHTALSALTEGDGNTALGANAGDVITQGSYNTLIGYETDAVLARENNVTALGAYGILKYFTGRITCDLGGTDENDPAHEAAIGKIPRYSVITRATAVIHTLSSEGTHLLKLVLSTDGSATDGTVLNGVQEVIGAGVAESWTGAAADGSEADINVASDATDKVAFAALGYGGDANLATIDTSAAHLYLYLAFANNSYSGDDTDPSTAPIIDVMIEYAGLI